MKKKETHPKLEEPNFAVQPHDDEEYYYVIAKEFEDSMEKGAFSALSFRDWKKKYKERYGKSGKSYLSSSGKKHP